MKKLIKGALFLAIVGTTIVGCEKSDDSPNGQKHSSTTKQKVQTNKSGFDDNGYADYLNIAKAANIERIEFLGSNQYEVTIYNTLNTYVINVLSFDEETNIDMEISNNGNTYDLEVDVVNETILLSSIHSSTFNTYESFEVSQTQNVIENISNVMMVHHALNPGTTNNFDDNGSGDVFPDNPSSGLKFWGWQTGVRYGPCGGLETTRTDCYKVLFISVKCEDVLVVGQPC